jgi:23S rRNA pseudouridine1911/1915/1917 synthase
MRLDHFLVRHVSDQSRSGLSKSIRSGHILVNNNRVKPGYKLKIDDAVYVALSPEAESSLVARKIDFEVLFEDDSLLVISKPPGLVVHPAAGHTVDTLANGLVYRYGELPGLEENRPGIVHRLDKDTSGIMLVARTQEVQRLLSEAFKDRLVHKVYHALLLRCPAEKAGRIVAPIGRHPVNRKKMAIRSNSGRYAVSSWRIQEVFGNGMCFAEISIETGRTHQIRVHMSSMAAPVVGDDLYGGKVTDSSGGLSVERQQLHASTISFVHPLTGQDLIFTAPLWRDMQQLLDRLRRDYRLE